MWGYCDAARKVFWETRVWNIVAWCPWVPKVPFPSVLPWKKSKIAFTKPRNRASVQRFCAIPGWNCAQAAARATWLLQREVQVSAWNQHLLQGRGERGEERREWGDRYSLLSWDYINAAFRKIRSFQTNQSISQAFQASDGPTPEPN